MKSSRRSSILLLIGILIVVAIGGLVEIAPLFWLESTIEKVQGMRPYTPLELAGRDIYIREGCYVCHSQMIRTLRDEVERYGHYSLAAESMYDHPFQWGSKRTGPDLARVGGKYSDEWHAAHLIDPRAVVPECIMPGYPLLAAAPARHRDIADHLRTLRLVGVPYTDEMIENAQADLSAQVDPDSGGRRSLGALPQGAIGKFDGNPARADRARRPGRLSAGAGHAGRLRQLRRRRPEFAGEGAMTYDTSPSIEPSGVAADVHRLFVGVLVYALWPRNKKRFEEAPRHSAREDESGGAGERDDRDGEARIDESTGAETTGHEWDGIKELNKPLPQWWL